MGAFAPTVRSTRRGAALSILAASALACAGAPRAGLLAGPAEEAATGLVWIVGVDGLHRTLWVSTADGRPIASQPIDGPVWASGSALWQWVAEPAPIPLSGCRDAPDEPSVRGEPVRTVDAQRVVLRELTRSDELELVRAPGGRPVRGLAHLVSPTASVGPYLFVTEEIDLDTCGAHPYVEARAFVWDLAAAERAELLTDRDLELVSTHEARRARGELARRSEVEDVRLVAIEPRWTSARLALAYRFVADVCRDCGDGEWGSHTIATRVEASALPERMAVHGRVPRWVQAAVAAVEGATLAGFTRVEHPAPARVLDALRR